MFKIVALIYAIVGWGDLADDPTITRTSPQRFDTIEACETYVSSAEFGDIDVAKINKSVFVDTDNDFEDADEYEIVPVCAPADQPADTVRPAGSP